MNPYAPPKAEPSLPQTVPQRFVAYIDGASLVVEKEAPLPPICLKCGAREDIVPRQQRFSWYPPWALFFLMVGFLIGLIAILITRKHGRLILPLCRKCQGRWRAATMASWFGVLFFIVGAFVSFLFAIRQLASVGDPTFFFVLFTLNLAVLLGIILGFVRPRTLHVVKINSDRLWLRGLHPAAIDAIVSAARIT